MKYENIAVSASKHQRELIGNVFAEDLLATLPSPLSDDQAKGLRGMADTEGAQAGSAYRQNKYAEMETAQTVKNHLDAKIKTTSARLETAEQELAKRRADPGSAILMIFAALCFLACVVAKYDVSLGTITWALSIRPDSFTGVIMALTVRCLADHPESADYPTDLGTVAASPVSTRSPQQDAPSGLGD
jgi:hypothetical protein